MRPFVVINEKNTSAPLDHSAAIELADTNRGFLPNRLTTAQRDAIPDPAAGLLVYNTSDSTYQFFDGLAWQGIGVGGGSPSGLVLIDSGTITDPVEFLDIPLPAGHIYFELRLFDFEVWLSDDTPTIDSICGALSYDGGTTFLCDPANSDTYQNHGINGGDFADALFFTGSAVKDFASSNGVGNISVVELRPGTAETLAMGMYRWQYGDGDVLNATTTAFVSSLESFSLNPIATITPTPAVANLVRIVPLGNDDCDPPTSGEKMKGTWTLLGLLIP